MRCTQASRAHWSENIEQIKKNHNSNIISNYLFWNQRSKQLAWKTCPHDRLANGNDQVQGSIQIPQPISAEKSRIVYFFKRLGLSNWTIQFNVMRKSEWFLKGHARRMFLTLWLAFSQFAVQCTKRHCSTFIAPFFSTYFFTLIEKINTISPNNIKNHQKKNFLRKMKNLFVR